MAELMSDDQAMRIAGEMLGLKKGEKSWAPADILGALEALMYRVLRLEKGLGVDELRERVKRAEADYQRVVIVESEDSRQAARARSVYLEIEQLALRGAEDLPAAAEILKTIAGLARSERLLPASSSEPSVMKQHEEVPA